MPAEPVPADPGRDDDLAWLDRDPMTAAERAEWLDRVCEHDKPPEEEDYEDVDPLTPEELAEVRQAASDDLLAVQAATTGRRGPGQPGSARVFPGESSSPAAGFPPKDELSGAQMPPYVRIGHVPRRHGSRLSHARCRSHARPG